MANFREALGMNDGGRSVGRTGTAAIVAVLAGCAPLLGVDDVNYQADSGAALDATVDGPSGDSGSGSNDAVAASDAPSNDASHADAAGLRCADGGAPIVETAVEDVDAWLSNDVPDQVYSPFTMLNVTAPNFVALFRFSLTGPAAEAIQSHRVLSMVATFSRALHDRNSCNVDGGPCPAHQGVLDVRTILPAWVPLQVSWNSRNKGVPWATPGAGGADESASVWASNVSIATNQVAVDFDLSMLDITSVQGDHTITLKLAGAGGLVFCVAAMQNQDFPEPSLVLTYCK